MKSEFVSSANEEKIINQITPEVRESFMIESNSLFGIDHIQGYRIRLLQLKLQV
jgi:hypothetical protein